MSHLSCKGFPFPPWLTLQTLLGVSGAGWSPCYDLYCTLPEPGRTTGDLSLHYSAMVTQSTGEHWTNALLTCVADASLSDTKQRRPSSVSRVQINTVQGSDASPMYYASPASSYAIAERMNVRSNGSQHKLPISVLTSTPTFTQVLSAGQDRAIATSVEMKNTGGRVLPAGNVSIYMNGSFASKARTTVSTEMRSRLVVRSLFMEHKMTDCWRRRILYRQSGGGHFAAGVT